jgi:hypothetical protein
MLRLISWDREGSLRESEGPWIGKGGESDVVNRHLQCCSPRLFRLRTDGLAPASMYWTYGSHAGDMCPVNRCSLLPTDAWLFPTASMDVVRKKLVTDPWIGMEALFLRSSGFVQIYWWLWERLPHAGTTRRKRMSGVRELAQITYVSCVSGFPSTVYIDSNHRNSRIWVTACLWLSTRS